MHRRGGASRSLGAVNSAYNFIATATTASHRHGGRSQTLEDCVSTTLTRQTQAALLALHDMASRTTDTFQLDRIERALDEIIRLNSIEPPPFQIRAAMSHASAVLRNRAQITPVVSLESPRCPDRGTPDFEMEAIDLREWLRSTRGLGENERQLLTLVADHDDSQAVAAEYGVALARIQERISRARRAARAAFATDMAAA